MIESSLSEKPVSCQHDTIVVKYYLKKNIENLEKELNILPYDKTILSSVSKKDAEEGFKILNYLQICPKNVFKSPWILYFDQLFELSAKDIIINLVRLQIISKTKQGFVKDLSERLLKKIEKIFPFQLKNMFQDSKF